jgi:hypothetical protein
MVDVSSWNYVLVHSDMDCVPSVTRFILVDVLCGTVVNVPRGMVVNVPRGMVVLSFLVA